MYLRWISNTIHPNLQTIYLLLPQTPAMILKGCSTALAAGGETTQTIQLAAALGWMNTTGFTLAFVLPDKLDTELENSCSVQGKCSVKGGWWLGWMGGLGKGHGVTYVLHSPLQNGVYLCIQGLDSLLAWRIWKQQFTAQLSYSNVKSSFPKYHTSTHRGLTALKRIQRGMI